MFIPTVSMAVTMFGILAMAPHLMCVGVATRFAQLNVTADAQVASNFTQPSLWHENDYLVGAATL